MVFKNPWFDTECSCSTVIKSLYGMIGTLFHPFCLSLSLSFTLLSSWLSGYVIFLPLHQTTKSGFTHEASGLTSWVSDRIDVNVHWWSRRHSASVQLHVHTVHVIQSVFYSNVSELWGEAMFVSGEGCVCCVCTWTDICQWKKWYGPLLF